MRTVTSSEAWSAVKAGRGKMIDVREPGEFRTVRVPDSVNLPLSSLEDRVPEIPDGEVYIMCASGSRSEAAAKILSENGRSGVVVEGGILDWQSRGLPLDASGGRRVWSMDRQVRFGAGLVVLTGLSLGWFIHPGYFLISAFVGCGLVFSGITGFCGMAYLLARAPWNR